MELSIQLCPGSSTQVSISTQFIGWELFATVNKRGVTAAL